MTKCLFDIKRTVLWNEVARLPQPWISICRDLFEIEEFLTYPASMKNHHNYAGGLFIHTEEVACRVLTKGNDFTNHTDITAFIAAIFHDSGKIWNKVVRKQSEVDKLILGDPCSLAWKDRGIEKRHHHACSSVAILTALYAKHLNIRPVFSEHDMMLLIPINHAILAHHGSRRSGALADPKTDAAVRVHQADSFSANRSKTRHKLPTNHYIRNIV